MILQQNKPKSTTEKMICRTNKKTSNIFDLVRPATDYRMRVEVLFVYFLNKI